MGRKPEGKAEKMFKNLGKKVDKLLVDIDDAKGKAKVEYADQIDELKKNGQQLKTELGNFKDKHQDKLDDIEEKLEKVTKDVKKAFESAFSKKS